VINKLYKKQIV